MSYYATKSTAEEAAIIAKLMMSDDVLNNPWEIKVWDNLGWNASIVLNDSNGNYMVEINLNRRRIGETTYSVIIHGNKHFGNAQWTTNSKIFFNPKEALKHELDSFELFCKRVEDHRNALMIKLNE